MTIRWRAVLIGEPWPIVWRSLYGIAGAGLLGLVLGSEPSTGVAVAGVTLQVLGLGTVALGIHLRRRQFGRPGFFASVLAKFRALLAMIKAPRATTRETRVVSDAVLTSDRASAWLMAAPDAPVDHRVEVLEQNLRQLRTDVRYELGEGQRRQQRLESELDQERTERVQGQRAMTDALEDVAIGGLHVEQVGLVWLLFGVVFGTLPGPTAQVLRAILAALGF